MRFTYKINNERKINIGRILSSWSEIDRINQAYRAAFFD